MIDLYYWPTPNGHKITIFLEETDIEYKLIPTNINSGAQFEPNFLNVSPNNKIPAIVDHHPADGNGPLAIFESGAILLYLAEKTNRFLSTQLRERAKTLEWLFWQVASLGPMAGQNHHFSHYASIKIPYAIERYVKETSRLYAVLNKQLADLQYIAGDYSIADMACYPWIVPYDKQQQNLDAFPNLKQWFERIQTRPAVIRAYQLRDQINPQPMDDAAKKILFGQDADTFRKKLD
jgi:GSH-dependent disulfide-bond oxidoreductase